MEGEKKEEIRGMFNNIARKYDFLNRLLSLGIDTRWRKRLVRRVAKQKPLKVLDLASGTADLAISMAKKMPQAHITGADISEKMLAVGYRKVLKQKLSRQIKLEREDAENLKYGSDRFDIVTIAFGVANLLSFLSSSCIVFISHVSSPSLVKRLPKTPMLIAIYPNR